MPHKAHKMSLLTTCSVTAAEDLLKLPPWSRVLSAAPPMSASTCASRQWRRQTWGTGARAPWSLRRHANYADLTPEDFHF